MSANFLDQLARDVARGMSRREVVRLLAGTTAQAMFGSSPRPAHAIAKSRNRPRALDCGGVKPSGPPVICDGTRTFYRANCQKTIPKLNYTPGCNGCGPEGGVFGTGISAVPNSPLYLANFQPACNTHDVGYSTCNRTKEDTDYQFLVDMNVICNNEYPGLGMFDTVLLTDCKYAATTFYIAVKDGGTDAFKAGQAGACDCCDECPGGAPKCGDYEGHKQCCPRGFVCHNNGEQYGSQNFANPCSLMCMRPSDVQHVPEVCRDK